MSEEITVTMTMTQYRGVINERNRLRDEVERLRAVMRDTSNAYDEAENYIADLKQRNNDLIDDITNAEAAHQECEETLKEITGAIRDGAPRRRLLKIIGPTPGELESQKRRLEQLEHLDYDHDREQWDRVMAACQKFEEKYC